MIILPRQARDKHIGKGTRTQNQDDACLFVCLFMQGNIGTGLRASLMMRLPMLIQRPDFLKIVAQLRLEARPAGSLDQWETTGDWPKLFGDTTSSLGSAEGGGGGGLGDTMESSAYGSTASSVGGSDDDDDDEDDDDRKKKIEDEDEDEERDAIRSGGGAVCIGNMDRLGRTEVELVNLVIYGAAQLVKMVRSTSSPLSALSALCYAATNIDTDRDTDRCHAPCGMYSVACAPCSVVPWLCPCPPPTVLLLRCPCLPLTTLLCSVVCIYTYTHTGGAP
jgi:hypothetical protein